MSLSFLSAPLDTCFPDGPARDRSSTDDGRGTVSMLLYHTPSSLLLTLSWNLSASTFTWIWNFYLDISTFTWIFNFYLDIQLLPGYNNFYLDIQLLPGYSTFTWIWPILNLNGTLLCVNNSIKLCDCLRGYFCFQDKTAFDCLSSVLQQFVNCRTTRWLYLHIDVNKWITTALFIPVSLGHIHWTGSGGKLRSWWPL